MFPEIRGQMSLSARNPERAGKSDPAPAVSFDFHDYVFGELNGDLALAFRAIRFAHLKAIFTGGRQRRSVDLPWTQNAETILGD